MKTGLPFNILVVDDDEEDREIIDEAFKRIGYESEVKKFLDGGALLKYLDQINASLYPSLIVLDNSLPGLEVERLVSHIKNDKRFKDIPVIVHSGTVSSSKEQKLRQLGVYAILEKGTTMNDVVKVAQQLKDTAEANRKENFKQS